MAAPTCDHQVRLHGADDAGAAVVASFLASPLLRGEAAVVVATPEHLAAFAAGLQVAGVDLDVVRAQGRYVELDAAATLAALRTGDRVDPERFERVVSEPVHALLDRFGAVSAYGEMVGLLTGDGDLPLALDLEGLWSGLMARRPFRLLCGYPREAFVGEAAVGFDAVLAGHDAAAADTTATACLLVEDERGSGVGTRRAVLDRCRDWGLGGADWLDDVELVVSELVGNAVRHTSRPAALALDLQPDGLVVSVDDGSARLPQGRGASGTAEDGRGLLIVQALAEGWGVEPRPGGKRVWARLRPVSTRSCVPA